MRDFLQGSFIEHFALIPLERTKIIKEYLLTKNGFDRSANAIIMLIPYRSNTPLQNLSAYASVKDYHLFVDELGRGLNEYVKAKYPNGNFRLFSDHSPIDEVHAACISGLGFIGDNGLLITEEYSSFVFLAEIITDLSPEALGMNFAQDLGVKECLHCGACKRACPSKCIKSPHDVDEIPTKAVCLSAITQKKGELTSEEIELMLDNNTVWGCDVCQNACPFTKQAKTTPIDFFKTDIISCLDSKVLNTLNDEEFKTRPFAWRGHGVVERNVKLYEERKNK